MPGIAITNVMRDIIGGDLIAGLTKLTESLLIATAIALGRASPCLSRGCSGRFRRKGIPTMSEYWQCLYAFIGCVGFCVIF